MHKQALNINNLLTGKIFSFLNILLPLKIVKITNVLSHFDLIKKIKTNNSQSGVNISLYQDEKNIKYIVKKYVFNFKDLFYWHIKNEVNILKILNKNKIEINKKKYSFPELVKFIDTKNKVILITKFCEGKDLAKMNSKKLTEILNECLLALSRINSSLEVKDLDKIPKRTPFHILISFPYFIFHSLLRDISDIKSYIKIAINFYTNYLSFAHLFLPKYFVTHRDLHVRNILVKNNNVSILDPGFMVLWEKNADLAIICYKYMKKIKIADIQKLLNRHLISRQDWKRFLSLMIYYMIQSLAVTTFKSADYKFAKEFKDNYLQKIFLVQKFKSI